MINNNVISIAKIYGSLFEYSCKKNDCASSHFVKQFLFSEVALQMSSINFIYSADDVPYLYEKLAKEKKLTVGKTIYPETVMYWMGYLIAVMVINHNLLPKQVYRMISPKELYTAYEAYHSLDIEDAAVRIIDSSAYTNKNDIELFINTRNKRPR